MHKQLTTNNMNGIEEIISASRVVAFYYCEVCGCHVSELECGVNVLHGF